MRAVPVPTITTQSGDLRGVTVAAPSGRDVHRFLGIPYAAAPVGDLRWRAPRPVAPWTGVRAAASFAPAAPQRGAVETVLPGFAPDGPIDEDCLALNVWTPSVDGVRPVLVWIPGGAYLSGGTAQPVYDAARLADEGDVVVVTVGYRLGALGFLALGDDADANCGLRDQLAALGWVREHADRFGGDPRRVTVIGESAGAGSLLHLLASPRRAGAFDRAIVQSGQPTTLDAAAAVEVADAFARALDLPRADAARLRNVPLEQLLDAQESTLAAMLGRVGPMPFAPTIDGDVCDGSIVDGIAAGRARDVELVIGTTRDELALFPDPRAGDLDDARLVRRIAALAPEDAPEQILRTYRASLGDAATNARIWDAVRTDAMMRVPNLRVADAATRAGTRTYVYRFDWEAPGLGAAHAIDIPFTFGGFDREGWGAVVGHDDRAAALGVRWRAAWTAFAADGQPGDPWWRRYDGSRPTAVFSADGVDVIDDPDSETRRCWMP